MLITDFKCIKIKLHESRFYGAPDRIFPRFPRETDLARCRTEQGDICRALAAGLGGRAKRVKGNQLHALLFDLIQNIIHVIQNTFIQQKLLRPF